MERLPLELWGVTKSTEEYKQHLIGEHDIPITDLAILDTMTGIGIAFTYIYIYLLVASGQTIPRGWHVIRKNLCPIQGRLPTFVILLVDVQLCFMCLTLDI